MAINVVFVSCQFWGEGICGKRVFRRFSTYVAGGMNITAAIALPTEFIAGVDVYYVPERPSHGGESGIEDSVVELPVPKVTWVSLRETQRTILKAILNEGGSLEAPRGKASRYAIYDPSERLLSPESPGVQGSCGRRPLP